MEARRPTVRAVTNSTPRKAPKTLRDARPRPILPNSPEYSPSKEGPSRDKKTTSPKVDPAGLGRPQLALRSQPAPTVAQQLKNGKLQRHKAYRSKAGRLHP